MLASRALAAMDPCFRDPNLMWPQFRIEPAAANGADEAALAGPHAFYGFTLAQVR